MTTSRTDRSRHRPLVRPRWVWGGLLAALVGIVVLGIGIMMLSAVVSAVGAVVLLAGGAASTYGGVMDDAGPHVTPQEELEQVEHGVVHEGVAPGDTLDDRRARQDARQTTARTDTTLARPRTLPAFAPVAGWTMLGIAAFIVLSQPWLLARTATGQDSAFRDGGLAIVLGLAGIRIATTSGRHLGSGVVALLAGAGLLIGGLVAEHGVAALAGVEVVLGLITVLAAGLALARPPGERGAV